MNGKLIEVKQILCKDSGRCGSVCVCGGMGWVEHGIINFLEWQTLDVLSAVVP